MATLAALAVISGCAAPSGTAAPQTANVAGDSFHNHRTFRYVRKPQSFTIPAGVTSLKITALGGLLMVHKDRVEQPFFDVFFGQIPTAPPGTLPQCALARKGRSQNQRI